MESAPASMPEIPVNKMMLLSMPPAPMTPSTRAKLDTRPSLAPNTAARKLPLIFSRPRAARPRTTSAWMASSAVICSVASASSA